MRLQNKVALVTGAARGIGAATARLFDREGASVALIDILEDEGEQVAKDIQEEGADVLFIHMDVRDEKSWDDAIDAILGRFGRLDVLVNSAGVIARGPFTDTTLDAWEDVMSTNVTGTFLATRACGRVMMERGSGSIINMSSIFGLVGNARAPAYATSKGAVRLFTKTAALQMAPNGVRVNCICPGFCRTPMTAPLWEDSEMLERMTKAHPLGRLGTAEDIAYGALYLASDESSFVTGAELVIDGGYTCQ